MGANLPISRLDMNATLSPPTAAGPLSNRMLLSTPTHATPQPAITPGVGASLLPPQPVANCEGQNVAGPPLGAATPADFHGLLHQGLRQCIREMEDRITQLPGIPKPIERDARAGFEESPFIKRIAKTAVPKKFTILIIALYNGGGDPDEHVSIYKQKMSASTIPDQDREAVMCKSFSVTLPGPALTWFTGLPQGSIASFADLVNLFKTQFASSRKIGRASCRERVSMLV